MPFAPSDLSNLFVWLRADTGAFQDAGLATPCTNGTAVYTWKNYGSDPSNFVQSSGGRQPVYNSAGFWPFVGGLPSITFTSDYLTSTTASIASGTAITVFVVARLSNPAATGILLGAGNGANLQIANVAGGANGYLYRGGGPASSFGAWGQGRPSILSAILDGNSPYCYAWMDGSSTANPNGVNNGNSAIANMHVGGDTVMSYPFNGDYFEIIVYNTKLSDADRVSVRTYLEGKYRPYITSSIPALRTMNYNPVNRPLRGANLQGERYQYGIRQETVDVESDTYRLAIDVPGYWRFRWGVESGSRSISCRVKQASNVSGQRPTMIVRANPSIGVNADVTVTAGAGTGWLDLGPASVTPTSNGVLWVELWNNDITNFYPLSPALFGAIETT